MAPALAMPAVFPYIPPILIGDSDSGALRVRILGLSGRLLPLPPKTLENAKQTKQ